MTTVNEIKAAIFDEWLKLEALKATITSPAGTYHDPATGKFTNRPGGAAGGGKGKSGSVDTKEVMNTLAARYSSSKDKWGEEMSESVNFQASEAIDAWSKKNGDKIRAASLDWETPDKEPSDKQRDLLRSVDNFVLKNRRHYPDLAYTVGGYDPRFSTRIQDEMLQKARQKRELGI